jgi:hypothetical protein
VLEPISTWIGSVFAPAHRDRTVAQVLGAAVDQPGSAGATAARRAFADAETRLRRWQAAVEAGADPVALVGPIARAQEQVVAARVECDRAPRSGAPSGVRSKRCSIAWAMSVLR